MLRAARAARGLGARPLGAWRGAGACRGLAAGGRRDGEEEDEEERAPRLYRRADSEMMVMEVDEDDKSRDAGALVEMLQRENREAAEVKVPWFLENMPPSYFKQVPPALREQHLAALVALYDFDAVPELTLNSSDSTTMTKISGGALTPGKLAAQVHSMPPNAPLTGMNVFNSLDGDVSLNIFQFQPNAPNAPGFMSAELEEYVDELMAGKHEAPLHAKPAPYLEKDALRDFLRQHCSQEYVSRSSPRRLCKQVELYHRVIQRGEDEVGVDIEDNWAGNPKRVMVTLGITNVLVMAAIRRLSSYFEAKDVNIVRTHLDILKGPPVEGEEDSASAGLFDMLRTNHMAMFRILVEASDASKLEGLEAMLREELPTVSKWMDDRAMALVTDFGISTREADVQVALSDVAHAILAPKDAYEFARSSIEGVLNDPSRIEYTREITGLFLRRFDPAVAHPERDDETFRAKCEEIRGRIRESGELRVAQETLLTLVDIVEGTYRTNAFAPERFGLCLRLDPELCVRHLLSEERPEVPYGIFFVHGRRFSGFHLRFRDISRGGLRIVTPRNREMLGVESARQLKECYDLAFAQQLKNKDIAEGGSKAVCLVDTGKYTGQDREHIMRKSLKAMVNSVLDTITPNEKDPAMMVDHMPGAPSEFIYFGPDEQVTPEHINWVVARAGKRGYPMPSAFMSSKPDAGINHKVYGVTSEGVAVFLHEALRSTGVDTDKPFTIKITGGPDGDVAGNMLNILYREYGENARVVGLADGTASLEDPDGIAWDELLRMFKEVLPLDQVDRSKLGPNAALHLCDTPAGINMRNTMHNRVRADAFVPAGGRPATINDSNWQRYLLKDGTPSSPLIVEGANLFLTPVAREELSKAGCVIVKDSSANKCGVICSSMEIIASMLLSKEEFLELKPVFVNDVLDVLRERATSEAQLMFREYKANPTAPLPPVSNRISVAINRSTDAFVMELERLEPEELRRLTPVIRDALPKSLMDKAWDRFEERVPPAYIRYQLACILASQLVYKEGVDYAMSIKEDMLGKWLLQYLERAIESESLADKLDAGEALDAADHRLVSDILRRGGARTMLDHHLTSSK